MRYLAEIIDSDKDRNVAKGSDHIFRIIIPIEAMTLGMQRRKVNMAQIFFGSCKWEYIAGV